MMSIRTALRRIGVIKDDEMTAEQFDDWMAKNGFIRDVKIGPKSFIDTVDGSRIGLYCDVIRSYKDIAEELLRMRNRKPYIGEVMNDTAGGSHRWNGTEWVNECPVCRKRLLSDTTPAP